MGRGAELGYALGYYTVEIDPEENGGLLDTDFVGKVNYIVNGFRGGVVVQF